MTPTALTYDDLVEAAGLMAERLFSAEGQILPLNQQLAAAHGEVAALRGVLEFKRRIKTQTVLPSAETAAMLFWALLASGQITMRKVNGWPTLAEKPTDPPIDLAA